MRVTGSLLLLLTSLIDISIPHCTIEDFISNVVDMVNSTNVTESNQTVTINSTYYNCLSRSDTSDYYSSMSVSILYIRSDDPNNIHEVRYNLHCKNSVWEIVGNQSTSLRNSNTRYCEDCTDQTVNKYHCTGYVGLQHFLIVMRKGRRPLLKKSIILSSISAQPVVNDYKPMNGIKLSHVVEKQRNADSTDDEHNVIKLVVKPLPDAPFKTFNISHLSGEATVGLSNVGHHKTSANANFRRLTRSGPCNNHPCNNGGSCVDEGGMASCNCVDGYIGDNCKDFPTPNITISPSGPIQGAMVGSPKMIQCTVSTVSGVESNSVMISWVGPRGDTITNDSRVTINPTTSDSDNTYTSSIQFTYLMEGDEGTYNCTVMIPKTNGSTSLELKTLTVPSPKIAIIPPGPIQGAMVGSPQMIQCTVSTVSGVKSSSVMISWIGPGGDTITNDSRVTINPTTSDSDNTYTSSIQFTYLMVGDEGTYNCTVMILKTNGSTLVELETLTVPSPKITITPPGPIQGAMVGSPQMIQCTASTVSGVESSSVMISWIGPGEDTITNDSRVIINPTTSDSDNTYTSSIQFTYLMVGDEGTYNCTVMILKTNGSTLVELGTLTVPSPKIAIIPPGPIQGAMVGSPQMIQCTVSTVSGVDSSSVMISWIGPGGDTITNDSRVIINPTTSDSDNTYTSSIQFTYLMVGDEGTYNCTVMILKTNGSTSVELETLAVPTPNITISPSGPIQGAMVGSPKMIQCTVSTVSGVESSSVMISWVGPRGDTITNDSRVTINPTTSDSDNTYTSSIQFTYLMEGDEGTYNCTVMILKTNGSTSVELGTLTVPTPNITISPSGPIQGAMVGSPKMIQCTVSTVSGVESNSVMISWVGPRGDTITNDSRVTINPTTSDSDNTYTSSIQFTYLMEGDEGTYNCTVMILKTNGSTSVELKAFTEFVGCQPEVDSVWEITWPPTEVGDVEIQKCPGGSGVIGYANRTCLRIDQWGPPIVAECQNMEYTELEMQAQEFYDLVDSSSNMIPDVQVLLDITKELANITTQPIFPNDLCSAANIVDIVISLIQLFQDEVDQSLIIEVIEYATDVLDSLLDETNDVSYEQLTSRGDSCMSIDEIVLLNTEQIGVLLSSTLESRDNQTVRATIEGRRNNIGIEAQILTEEDLMQNGTIEFHPDPQSSDSVFAAFGNMTPSYTLPHDVIINQINKTESSVPVISTVIRNSRLFNNQSARVESLILSVQISSNPQNRTSLGNEMITISFNIGMSGNRSRFNARCVFFDHSSKIDLSGYFSTDGVTLITNNSTVYQCSSNHLTSFAVLVDVSGDGSDSEALSILSYIGCSVSIVCLLIAVIAFIGLRRRVFNLIQHFVHLNLSIALLLALVTFVSGIETATEYRVSCLIVTILLHYFFMAAFSWMLCEGILLFIMIKFVFYHGFLKRKLFFLILGWGLPIPIVAVSGALSHDHYGINDRCWISEEKGAIWAFAGPMLLIIMINCFFLAVTMREVCKSNNGSTSTEKITTVGAVKSLLKAAVIITPLLGCTWVIGLLAINEDTTVFAWAFAILNSLQGLAILVLYVLKNEKFLKKMKTWGRKCYSQSTGTHSTNAKSNWKTGVSNPPHVNNLKATTHDNIGDLLSYSHSQPPSYMVQNNSAVDHEFQTKPTYCSQESNDDGLDNSVQLKDLKHHNEESTVFIGEEDHL